MRKELGGFKFVGVFWLEIKYEKEGKKINMTIIPIFLSIYNRN